MRKLFRGLDALFEGLELLLLLVLVLVVLWQVFSRYVLFTTPRWSTELALILMIWVGFLGIAVGFRERIHIALEVVVSRLPRAAQTWMDRGAAMVSLLFGLYLMVQGWEITVSSGAGTLPGTGLPRSALYAIVPVAGLMIAVYSALHLAGVETERHPESSTEDQPETTQLD